MSEEREEKANRSQANNGVQADFGHLSVTGHVVFAGRDGSVNVNTGGDVAQNTNNMMTVAGVETTRDAYNSMVSTLDKVEKQYEEEAPDEDTSEAAIHYLRTIKKLLMGKKKPNLSILMDSVKSLKRLGPIFAGGAAQVMAEPLVTKIMTELGENASRIIQILRR